MGSATAGTSVYSRVYIKDGPTIRLVEPAYDELDMAIAERRSLRGVTVESEKITIPYEQVITLVGPTVITGLSDDEANAIAALTQNGDVEFAMPILGPDKLAAHIADAAFGGETLVVIMPPAQWLLADGSFVLRTKDGLGADYDLKYGIIVGFKDDPDSANNTPSHGTFVIDPTDSQGRTIDPAQPSYEINIEQIKHIRSWSLEDDQRAGKDLM